jgi:hypothetical protein
MAIHCLDGACCVFAVSSWDSSSHKAIWICARPYLTTTFCFEPQPLIGGKSPALLCPLTRCLTVQCSTAMEVAIPTD